MRLCDICRKEEATRVESVAMGGVTREYAYCEACFRAALAAGRKPCDVAEERLSRIGFECPDCGYTVEDFNSSYLFGCPACYDNMRSVARDEIKKLYSRAGGASPVIQPLSGAQRELVREYVVSSRVRLARNVSGLPFPKRLIQLAEQRGLGAEERAGIRSLLSGALLASEGVFDAELYRMDELDNLKKKMLVERHIISLPLANHPLGAVIIESGQKQEISVMLNEEDHIRAQCVHAGLDLDGAYKKLHKYDLGLSKRLRIARSGELGYLTACPTNVGTGMRASVMVFLPALALTGRIEGALERLRRDFGTTVRGYYGEGSGAAYDMYQISNADTLLLGEEDTVRLVECAAMEICAAETVATRDLLSSEKTKLYDRLERSLGNLLHAHTIEADELLSRLADVRFGVRIGIFSYDLAVIDAIIEDCASAFEILSDGISAEQRGVRRAEIVRERLGAK